MTGRHFHRKAVVFISELTVLLGLIIFLAAGWSKADMAGQTASVAGQTADVAGQAANMTVQTANLTEQTADMTEQTTENVTGIEWVCDSCATIDSASAWKHIEAGHSVKECTEKIEDDVISASVTEFYPDTDSGQVFSLTHSKGQAGDCSSELYASGVWMKQDGKWTCISTISSLPDTGM